MVEGFHVPEIPFVDVAGKVGAKEFWQSGPIWLNVGVISVIELIVTVAEAKEVHPAALVTVKE
jgi:hypothetical protein